MSDNNMISSDEFMMDGIEDTLFGTAPALTPVQKETPKVEATYSGMMTASDLLDDEEDDVPAVSAPESKAPVQENAPAPVATPDLQPVQNTPLTASDLLDDEEEEAEESFHYETPKEVTKPEPAVQNESKVEEKVAPVATPKEPIQETPKETRAEQSRTPAPQPEEHPVEKKKPASLSNILDLITKMTADEMLKVYNSVEPLKENTVYQLVDKYNDWKDTFISVDDHIMFEGIELVVTGIIKNNNGKGTKYATRTMDGRKMKTAFHEDDVRKVR